ncbi:MAG TPA: manganese efflux pump [Chloroflexota bacterium]|nr:manganese efflux pump [Chloroflexota bacterium]
MTIPILAKTAGLVLSLGFDTFAVSVALGISGLQQGDRLRYGVAFAGAEGIMPLVGFLAGSTAAHAVGPAASWVAIILLLAVGLYTLYESFGDEEPEFRGATLPVLLLTALSVSLDELAAGFSLGLLGIPVALAIPLIAAQALLVTLLGTGLGARLGERVAHGAERLSGVTLSALALFLLAEHLTRAG